MGKTPERHSPQPTRTTRALTAGLALWALTLVAACGGEGGGGTEPGQTSGADAGADATTAADASDAATADTETDTSDPPNAPVVDGSARFTVVTPTLIRLEYAEDGQFEDRPTQTVGARPSLDTGFESRVEGGEVIVETEALTLRYRQGSGPFSPENLQIALTRGDEAIIASPAWGADAADDDGRLGGWLRGLDLVQTEQPYHEGLLTRRGWYLLDDSETALLIEGSPGFATRPAREGAYQDGYFFGYGLDYRGALADLRALAGPAPLLPRKALGVWFSRYWPYSDADWRALLGEFRAKGVPLDVISLDTDWKRSPEMNACASLNALSGAPVDAPCSWNGWGWNEALFPDPSGFMTWAREEGLQVGLNIHPSINESDPAYPEALAIAGTLEPDPTLLSCQILQADPASACLVFDWTNPAHVEAYFGLHAPIAEAGVDFWWLDWCCEGASAVAPGLSPDAWINALYADDHRRTLGSRWPSFSRIGGSFQEGPLGKDEGQGAFAEHRASIHFTGDTCSTWELMRYVAEFTVAEGASIGLPYVSHDIGSFHGYRPDATTCTASEHTPKLPDDMYVRWVQLGTFQPLDRLHSQHGDRLPWEYPGDAEQIAAEFLRLRGRLVPHLYTLSREAHDAGLPMARALYLQWPEHDGAYAYPSSFTLGDDLLVVTVAAPGEAPMVEFWLPPGAWVDLFTGDRLEGPGVVQREVPLDRYPVFAREGSILPTQPDLPTSSDGPQGDLVLNVWGGEDGEYALYEDEGVGFAFEGGAYRWTRITSTSAPGCHTVTAHEAEGAAFTGALTSRSWTIRLVGVDDPGAVTVAGAAATQGDGAPGWTYDAATRTVTALTGESPTDQALEVRIGEGCP